MSDEMTFEQISEFMEKAGSEAAQTLTLELLREAAEEIQELRLVVETLLLRVGSLEASGAGIGPLRGGKGCFPGSVGPVWQYSQMTSTGTGNINQVQCASTTNALIEKIDTLIEYENGQS